MDMDLGGETLKWAFNNPILKFYPFIHRCNSQYNSLPMPKIDGQFNGFEILGIAGPLFIVISKSDLLAEETKKYLTKILTADFINQYSIDSILKTHDSYYYSSAFRRHLNLYHKNQIQLNIRVSSLRITKQIIWNFYATILLKG
jgi:hypothetical protein